MKRMKGMKGILGASLAGFAVLTLAAVTTSATEAIAFKAAARQVRVITPTSVRSVSYRHRVPHRTAKIPSATSSVYSRIDHTVSPVQDGTVPPFPPDPPSPSRLVPETSVMGEVRIPNDHSLPETELGAKRRKEPKYFDTKLQHIMDDFDRMRNFWEFPNAIPPEANTSKFDRGPATERPNPSDWDSYIDWVRQNDASNHNPYTQLGRPGEYTRIPLTENDSIKLLNWDGYGQQYQTYDYDFSVEANYQKSGNGSKDGSSGTSGGTKPQNDSTNEKIKNNGTVEEVVQKEKDNTNGGEGDDGNDPDEMRNAVQSANLNMHGLRGETASGGRSGSQGQGDPGSSTQRTDGTGWFRRHNSPNGALGAVAGVEDGGPAEMANPMGVRAAAINLRQGQAMSPTVDDQQNGSGPSGPIGPVATQAQAAPTSLNMDSRLNAAMSDPMGSPMVDGNGDGYHGGPVDPR